VVELGGKLEEEVSRHMSDELQLRKEVKACQVSRVYQCWMEWVHLEMHCVLP
jgi:hypothetical protein